MKYVLGLICILFIIAVIIRYRVFFLTLTILGLLAFIAVKIIKKRKSIKAIESGSTAATESQKAESPKAELQNALLESVGVVSQPGKDPRIEQFENELQSIQRIEIPSSDPVPKQFLKDMPEYYFSNITRTTRMDTLFPLVFLDVETTGLYPSKSEIVEVSAIKFESGMVPVSCFTTLCKPSKPIPEEASAINKITDDMVQDAPSFREIAPALTEYLHGCNISGHNLEFDLRFIFVHGVQIPWDKRFFDTLDLAHYTIEKGNIPNYKLETLCRYYGIKREDAHRSLSDCYATSKIFSRLVFDKTSRQLEVNEEAALCE